MPDTRLVTVTLRQQQDYRFENRFQAAGGAALPALVSDEPPPLGQEAGPAPTHLLAAAVGNCLSASLLFAARKFHEEPGPLAAEVSAEVGRNAQGRVRVLALHATLTLGVRGAALPRLERVLASFEDYCTVTQSVRQGLPVHVTVKDADGALLKAPAP